MDKSFNKTMLMSPLGKSPRFSTGGSRRQSLRFSGTRSVQSTQILYRSQMNVVETFGGPLPVFVHEALTFSDKNTSVSVRISNDGWAWFVCGRRLLIWQCRSSTTDDTGGRANRKLGVGSSICRELTLPSSDLAYRAELVTVFVAPGNQVPSCIASSPEGVVRYWPSIAYESSSIEASAELQGEECDSLTSLGAAGCVLATTTSSIVLITPQLHAGKHEVLCKPMRPPHGWQLGGITKMIMPYLTMFSTTHMAHPAETKLIKVAAVLAAHFDKRTWILYILAGHSSLQKWIVTAGESERLVYECDVNCIAVDAFHKTIWPCTGNPNDILVWSLDLHTCDNGVIILVGATNPQASPQFHYALGTLTTDSVNPPTKFQPFNPLKYSSFYRETEESDLLNFRILLHGQNVLMYNKETLLSMSAINFGEDCDTIDFLGMSDKILGAALVRGTPVFFTKEHGLISITPSDFNKSDMFNASLTSESFAGDAVTNVHTSEPVNVAVSDDDLVKMTESKDVVLQTEAAFLYYLRKQFDNCQRLLQSLFPPENEPAMRVDAILDTVIVQISRNMLDEIPAGDPRWAGHESSLTPAFGCSSLQIKHQLEGKLSTTEWLHSFLRHQHLWDRLNNVTMRDMELATKHVLAEHCEKLIAAAAMKELHSTESSVMLDSVVKYAAEHIDDDEEEEKHSKNDGVRSGKDLLASKSGLTAQDVFYRRASRLHIGLQAAVAWCETVAHSDRRPQDCAALIATANQAILTILQAVLSWRKQNFIQFKVPVSQTAEYLPWTAAPGQQGLRDCLTLLHSLTLKYGARAIGDASLKGKLYEQLVQITDILLDGRRAHCESLRNHPKYDTIMQQFETTRLNLLKPFVADCEYERAAILAEKYLDFHILIQICELTDNHARLDAYCDKFSEYNFSKYSFNWFLKEGKQGRLLEKFREKSTPLQQKHEFHKFLGDHPSLSWLQNVFSNQFRQAHDTLESMANAETELLCRKKTMLSLAKLCVLAADDEPEEVIDDKVTELDSFLRLISDVEDLPETVLSAYGYEPGKLPVLLPSQVIKLYICEENETADPMHFKRALDLLPFVEDDTEREELRYSIWCKAILRDSWDEVSPDASTDDILNLFFFKLADLVECLGGSLEESLPPCESILTSEELGDLKSDKHFQYLIRLGYEHIHRIAS